MKSLIRNISRIFYDLSFVCLLISWYECCANFRESFQTWSLNKFYNILWLSQLFHSSCSSRQHIISLSYIFFIKKDILQFLFYINCRFLWNWKLASNQNIFATWDHEPYCNMRSWTLLQHEIMNHISFFPIMNYIRFNIQSISISNLNISFWQIFLILALGTF